MLDIACFDDNFYEEYEKEPRDVIVYGAGWGYKNRKSLLPKQYTLIDRNWSELKCVEDMAVYPVEQIRKLANRIYLIITVKGKASFYEICEELAGMDAEARVFHLYDNVAFDTSLAQSTVSYVPRENTSALRVNLICEDRGWILSKFADRMETELMKMGVKVSVSEKADRDVDINHHIQYATYETFPNDTLMISHINGMKQVWLLKKQLKTASMGICMSRETMESLVLYGIPREKLCYINPAHDGCVGIKKYVIGITHRCYEWHDVRKRASALLDILSAVDPQFFRFVIMGSGWEQIINSMEKMGFETTYYPEFNYDTYMRIIPQMDYYLYMGFDEGSMGYLDAVAAGVGTIVTPQGYHLDNRCPIDYPCSTIEEFREAFLDLQSKREKKCRSVREWSWENYTRKHLEIWDYILRRKSIVELFQNQLWYEDGIFSALIEDNRVPQ